MNTTLPAIESEAPSEAGRWSQPALGFRLIGYGAAIQLVIVLFPIALPWLVILADVSLTPRLVQMQAQTITVGSWGALVLCGLGFGLCAAAPRFAGRRVWILAAAVGVASWGMISQFHVPALQWVYGHGHRRLALSLLAAVPHVTNLLTIVAMGAFLYWVRCAAQHWSASRQAKLALDLLQTGAIIVFIFAAAIAWLVAHATVGDAPSNGNVTPPLLLSLLLPGCGVGGLIWLGAFSRLMFGMSAEIRRSLSAAVAPAAQ